MGKPTILRLWFALAMLMLWAASCSPDPAQRARTLVSAGDKYLEAGKLKEASIMYRRAIQEDARNAAAYYGWGRSAERLGRIRQALNAYRRAVELDPSNEEAYARLADLCLAIYLRDPARFETVLKVLQEATERVETARPNSFAVLRAKGLLAMFQKEPDYEAALELLNQARELKPDDGRTVLAISDCLVKTGREQEAIRTASDYLERRPDFVQLYDFLYLTHLRARRYDEALRALQAKIERFPDNLLYRLELARHYASLRRAEEMEAVLDELLADAHRFPGAHMAVGDFYVRLGAFDNAVEIYRQGLEAEPEKETAYKIRMVEVLSLQGHYDEAYRTVEEVLEKDPENSAARALRGALRLRAGGREELAAAVGDFEAALVQMPNNAVLRYNLAEAHRAMGDLDRAELEYRAAVDQRPDYLPARYRLAGLYSLRGEYAKAVAEAERILEYAPGDLNAQLVRADAWMRMGELAQARRALEELLEKHPDNPNVLSLLAVLDMRENKLRDAERRFRRLYRMPAGELAGLNGLAQIYIRQRRPEAALELLQKAAEKRPENTALKLQAAFVLNLMGRREEAVGLVQEVLKVRPNHGEAYRLLGGIYYSGGDFTQSDAAMKRAAELRPRDPVPLLYLGMAAERVGALPKAMEYYRKTIEVAPNNVIALNNLAYVLAETSTDLDEALTLAQRARNLVPNDPNVIDTLAYVYMKHNLVDRAISLLEEVVEKYPKVALWRYHLAMALHEKGLNEQARRHLEAALQSNPTGEEEFKIRELLGSIGS